MKLSGFSGTGSGRLGSSVFSVRKGEQIVRQHQPHVANPSTQRQLEVRAGFKLLNQIATVFSDYLSSDYIVGKGTSRNGFVSHLFSSLAYLQNDDGEVVAYIPRNRIALSPRTPLVWAQQPGDFAFIHSSSPNDVLFNFDVNYSVYSNELEGVTGLRMGVVYAMFANSQLYSSQYNLISVIPCSSITTRGDVSIPVDTTYIGRFLTAPVASFESNILLFEYSMSGFGSTLSFPGVDRSNIICMAYPVIFAPRGAVAARYNGALPSVHNGSDIVSLSAVTPSAASNYVMFPVTPVQCKIAESEG